MRQMIEYKALKAGHSIMLVDPAYTSQACPRCGLVRKANRKHRAHEYVCAGCGYRSNDDRVAAMNIRRLGYAALVESQTGTS
nr:transposase [Bifidobacterium longum]